MKVLKLFVPHYYIESFQTLSIEYLKKHHIKVLFCDIDNTLVAHDEASANEEVIAFLQKVKQANIEVIFISNNVKERVYRFAEDFDIQAYAFARKPLKMTYKKIMRDTGYRKGEIAVLGDQLLTDILGGNRMGYFTILTSPVVKKDLTCTKFNRKIESILYFILEKRKKLRRGVYDENM